MNTSILLDAPKTIFQIQFAPFLHTPQQCMRVLVVTRPLLTFLLLSILFILAILVVAQYYIEVLICIFWMTNETEHFSATWISSFMKNFFQVFSTFFVVLSPFQVFTSFRSRLKGKQG